MANIPSATPGTLAEHDIVISISEEAINRQFQLLYDTPIKSSPGLPPPPGTRLPGAGGTVTKAPKYLINHTLQVYSYYTDENNVGAWDTETGIFANIKCPRISLNEEEPNMGRITFEFQRDETAERPNSEIRIWGGHPRAPKILAQPINGWSMSWKVRISQRKFGDFPKELVAPLDSGTNPAQALPEIQQSLKEIDPREFTVASIFCMFEDGLIANSFKITDDKGMKPTESAVNNSMLLISNYFQKLQDVVDNGVPTPDHPFILGYSLSQKVPELKDVNPDAKTDNTPKYLIPRACQMTVTPGKTFNGGVEQKSKYSNGTLNFCLLTYREDRPTSMQVMGQQVAVPPDPSNRKSSSFNIAENANSGKLTQTFMDLTRTSEHDGVMGFARDLIWDKYIRDRMLDAYHMDPHTVIRNVEPDLKRDVNISSDLQYPQDAGKAPSVTKKTEFKVRGIRKFRTMDDRSYSIITSTTKVEWISDLQTNPNIENNDAIRRAYVTVNNFIRLEQEYVETGLKDTTYNYDYDVAMKYVWAITTGKGGIINLEKLETETRLPVVGGDGQLQWQRGRRAWGQYGAFMYEKSNKDKAWETIKKIADPGGIIGELINGVQGNVTRSMKEALTNQVAANAGANFDALKNKVIMPAGNVFNYSGVDIDSQGNMFTHISFGLGAEGVEQNTDVKGTPMINSGMRRPVPMN